MGVAALARGEPGWIAAGIAAVSVVGGAALAAAWSARREPPPADLERSDRPSQVSSAIFKLEGEYWTIALDGPTVRLADTKGLRYIHRLLERPGVKIHAFELERLDQRNGRPPDPNVDALPTDGPSDQPLIDESALRAYRRRADELREEIEEAERNNDSERASASRQELALLVDEIRRAQRPGGKVRTMPGPADKARVNVTRAIRSAITKIQDQEVSLGHHLDREIHTGTYCWYEPDPNARPDWSL